MTKTIFTARRFIATQHSSADEKARFCNWFVRFVRAGFASRNFAPQFYRRLSTIFGFIAHYDETGFYEVWFATPEKQRHFIQRIYERIPMGQPEFCWVDVERELKSWVTQVYPVNAAWRQRSTAWCVLRLGRNP